MMNSLPTKFRQGDVVLCRMPMPTERMEGFKNRPAVIVSANRLNDILNTVMVVAFTSNTNHVLSETQYLIQGEEIACAGIKVESVVRCQSIFTLNKSMIIKTLGSLTVDTMKEINRCLIVALELAIAPTEK